MHGALLLSLSNTQYILSGLSLVARTSRYTSALCVVRCGCGLGRWQIIAPTIQRPDKRRAAVVDEHARIVAVERVTVVPHLPFCHLYLVLLQLPSGRSILADN